MSSRIRLFQNSGFVLFTLIGFSLFYESCDNVNNKASKEERLSTVDTLPDSVTTQGVTMMTYFDTASGNLSQDFLFDEGKDKATYFKLNKNQASAFFKELERKMKKNLADGDSVWIRVFPGLQSKAGTKQKGRPNLTLLMSVSDTKADSAAPRKRYPLKVFLPNQHAKSEINLTKIPNPLADTLVKNWKKSSNNDINKQLYLQDSGAWSKAYRIRHYSFIAKDTKEIYNYQKKYPNCGFYVYLGKLDQPNEVPLRIVIRLTSNGLTLPPVHNQIVAYDENFEFSVQCPNHCQ